jgi:hypothetical protein
MDKISIIQHGTDGMGHQLHGLLSCLALHNVGNYYFDGHSFVNKKFAFDHLNQENSEAVKEYLIEIGNNFIKVNNQEKRKYKGVIYAHEVYKIPQQYSADTLYLLDNSYYFNKIPINEDEYKQYIININQVKSLFINEKLPPNRLRDKNVVFHLRQGDAITCGRGKVINDYNKKIVDILPKLINNYKDYTFYIHTDGEAGFITNVLFNNNIRYVVYLKNENILNVLSDFIHSNVFIAGISGLSIVCTFLGNHNLTIVSDDVKHSLPNDVVRISDYLFPN